MTFALLLIFTGEQCSKMLQSDSDRQKEQEKVEQQKMADKRRHQARLIAALKELESAKLTSYNTARMCRAGQELATAYALLDEDELYAKTKQAADDYCDTVGIRH